MNCAAPLQSAVRIETERLVLRDWREEDWPAFFRHTNNPGVMRWLGGVMTDELMAQYPAAIRGCRERYGHSFWLVERLADGGHLAGEILGFCGLKRANAPGSSVLGEFEIGWRLREDAWHQGYAREAAEAALAAGFDRFGAEWIVALTVIGNEPSWRLMQRLGMKRRADLDYEELDKPEGQRLMIVYSIDKAGWAARTKAHG